MDVNDQYAPDLLFNKFIGRFNRFVHFIRIKTTLLIIVSKTAFQRTNSVRDMI